MYCSKRYPPVFFIKRAHAIFCLQGLSMQGKYGVTRFGCRKATVLCPKVFLILIFLLYY